VREEPKCPLTTAESGSVAADTAVQAGTGREDAFADSVNGASFPMYGSYLGSEISFERARAEEYLHILQAPKLE